MFNLTKKEIENFKRKIKTLNIELLEKLLVIIPEMQLEHCASKDELDQEFLNNLQILYSCVVKELRHRRRS